MHFYPRSPCGERPSASGTLSDTSDVFLSTLSLRRATRCELGRNNRKVISIHALLAESDDKNECTNLAPNPFLSTLSLRRATSSKIRSSSITIYFYPRSPCGERLYHLQPTSRIHHFYPRSPCGERLKTPCVKLSIEVFLSTLSLRRATLATWQSYHVRGISIHALLAESDKLAEAINPS